MSPRGQLLGVQYLRGLAALAVVYFHSSIQIAPLQPYFLGSLAGKLNFSAGVDVFFVISGFIMYLTGRNLSPGNFWLRRLIRIVPLYWILTLLIALIVLVKPEVFKTTVVNGTFLLKSLLFIPYSNPAHGGDMMPILVPGWSLNMEMVFYLIFGTLLFAPKSWLVPGATLVFAALVVMHVVGGAHAPALAQFMTVHEDSEFYRVLEFYLGIIVGQQYVAGKSAPPRALLLPLACAAVVTLLWPTPPGPGEVVYVLTTSVLPSAVLIYVVVFWEKGWSLPDLPALHKLGDASYSLYLGHLFALGMARLVWTRLGPAAPSVASAAGFALLGLVASVTLALALYRWVEMPVTDILQRRLLPARKPATA